MEKIPDRLIAPGDAGGYIDECMAVYRDKKTEEKAVQYPQLNLDLWQGVLYEKRRFHEKI